MKSTVGDDEHELLELRAAAANLFSRDAQSRSHGFEELNHWSIGQGVVFRERQLAHERWALLVGKRRAERMQRAHRVGPGAEAYDTDLSDL